MTSARETQTLVIGGGLNGAFTALFLARAGHRVTVLEKGYVGAQSSGANFGNLRLQGRDVRQYPLSLRAQELWEQLDQLIGDTCEYDRSGHIYLAYNDEEVDKLEAYAKTSRQFGLQIEDLDGAEIRRRYPYLSDKIVAGTYSARDATANPRLTTPAVMRAARALGAELIENCEFLTAKTMRNGFVVETQSHGIFRSDQLVNAAGAWGRAIAQQFDEETPLFSAGPPQFVTEPLPYFIRPSVQAVAGNVIFRQIPRGNVIVAGYPRTASDLKHQRTVVPPLKTLAGMRSLAEVAPVLGDAQVIRVWSGMEGYLPDMIPIISPSATTQGLFHAFGCCGHGFQIAPGVGAVLAEMILHGSSETPVGDFSIHRFHDAVVAHDKIKKEFD
ncbi:FAD-binding oxidoreductase [Ochrobactrum sp. AN78]|uniref:NAD(P)/FAD-dependent oxidoreductase n=1 Tax=Ochrobactrum sp. AN78 TaxID=3039853 RepID=UPI00298A01B4|nr:FAD-binding oxidoreductase [Ochrobactrum sp. AN78]MDH7792114.1 sarcosine oxidase subunit beta [Ochrobactrum sp. AN78]